VETDVAYECLDALLIWETREHALEVVERLERDFEVLGERCWVRESEIAEREDHVTV
jgi:hypothetical protein